ncbi:MAG: hypothetical protein QM751_00070 [Paludibacteraceae bacterium]
MNQRTKLAMVLLSIIITPVYTQTSEINWQTSLLKIDGNNYDWHPIGKNLRFYDSKSQLKYEFRNDSINLYFVFESDSPLLQHQISQAGLSLKFTIKEKTKRFATLTIVPKKGMPEKFIPRNQTISLDELAQKEEVFPKDTAYLQGFKFSENYIVSGNNDYNNIVFDISKGIKSNKTVFELQIPLRDFFGSNYKLDNINQIPLQIQLTINTPTKKNNTDTMKGRMDKAGDFGGGGGMRPGGGMNGGPGRDGGGEMQEMGNSRPENMQNEITTEKKDMKFEFYLTNKKTK